MNIEVSAAPIIGYLLASVRVVAWLVLVPPFSAKSFPTQAKIILALALSFLVRPPAAADLPTSTFALIAEVVTQVAIGASLGFVAMMLMAAISAAGSFIDVFGGFALSAAYDPLGMQMSTVFGKFYQILATTLLFTTGGHLILIGGLIKTFEFSPIGQVPDLRNITPVLVIEAFSTFFLIAVQLALPMIAVLIIADIGLALLTKVSPQLNAMTFLFPAKIGLVLLLVGATFPMLPEAHERLVDLANRAAFALTGGGGGG